MSLPRGIWFEAKHKRYRVRLYRNRRAYLAGYFKTEDEAREALTELEAELGWLAKRWKGETPTVSTFAQRAGAVRK